MVVKKPIAYFFIIFLYKRTSSHTSLKLTRIVEEEMGDCLLFYSSY